MQLATAGVVEMKSIAERVLDLKRIFQSGSSHDKQGCELLEVLESSKKGQEFTYVVFEREAREFQSFHFFMFHLRD